jgi:hypothetical protein
MRVSVELPGEGFNPVTGQVVRHDRGLKQWVRGFFKNRVVLNFWHLGSFLGSAVTAALGAYSATVALIDALQVPQITAFLVILRLMGSLSSKWGKGL